MKKAAALQLFALFFLFSASLFASAPDDNIENVAKANNMMGKRSLLFIENKGQITDTKGNPRPDILYTADGSGVKLFITKTGIYYQFSKLENPEAIKQFDKFDHLEKTEEIKTTTYRLEMHLLGANKNAEVVAENKNEYYENYFNVPSYPDGIIGVHSFEKIKVKNIYPNIDWVLYVKDNKLEYDFVVNPDGNVSDIKISYDGDKGVNIMKDGSMEIYTPYGKIKEGIPNTYQSFSINIKQISSSYIKLGKHLIGFKTEKYLKNQTLTIDPILNWINYYGGPGEDRGNAVTTDLNGDVYLGGYTSSTSYISNGGFQNTYGGGSYDAFLAKFNSAGVAIWATYYGGSDSDIGWSLATDNSGNIYFAGETVSTSGIANGGFQNIFGGGSNDGFLVKFNSLGGRIWATYYGGTDFDLAFAVATDASGNVYFGGQTNSTSGIANAGFQNILGSGFLVKLDNAGARLWATYYNGPIVSIATDASGNVYAVGSTAWYAGIASGGFQNILGGGLDAFLVKFNSAGARLWATYYGWFQNDCGSSVATDINGDVYLAGVTSSNANISNGGFQNTYAGNSDAFLVKFNSLGARLWATYYGGYNQESYYSLTLVYKEISVTTDAIGNVYLAGTTSSDSSIASGGFQNTFSGGFDVFLVKFSSSGARIGATYFGIQYDFFVRSLASGSNGDIYIAGFYFSPSIGSFLISFSGTCFLKVDPAIINNEQICNSNPVVLTIDNPILYYNYLWSNGDTGKSITITTPGTYSVQGTYLNCPTQNGTATPTNYPNCGGFLEIISDTTINFFDTLNVKVKINVGVNIFSVFSKIKFDSNLMKLIESTPGNFLGTNIIATPPIVTGDSIDFGITKTNGQSGSNGDGIIYSFKFVLTNLPFDDTTYTKFQLNNISVYNTLGLHPTSFADISLTQSETKIKYYVPVWPGDLNNDYSCNVADILPIGYFYNSTGPVRTNGSLFWAAQPAPLWGYDKTYTNSSAYKTFADGNADGQVNLADQAAIGFNLSNAHLRLNGSYQYITDYHQRQQALNTPPLTVSIAEDSVLSFPHSVVASITVGSNVDVATNIYGLAFDVLFNASCINTSNVAINFTNVFGTLNTDYIRIIDSTHLSQGKISFGITRFNSSPLTFNGTKILSITFPLYQGCASTNCEFKVAPHLLSCNMQDGTPLTLNEESDLVVTCYIGINELAALENSVVIFSNPSYDKTVSVTFEKAYNGKTTITIRDVYGKVILPQESFDSVKEFELHTLDLKNISKGIYFIEVTFGNKTIVKKLLRM